jgi:hypothetical protein
MVADFKDDIVAGVGKKWHRHSALCNDDGNMVSTSLSHCVTIRASAVGN